MSRAQLTVSSRATHLLVALLVLGAVLIAVPVSAQSGCYADPAGDVLSRGQGNPPVDEPRSDILAVCTSLDADQLTVTIRVASFTDPATDPAWDATATVAAVSVDIDGVTTEEAQTGAQGGEEFLINLGRFPEVPDGPSGPPETRVYIGGTQRLASTGSADCVFPAIYDGIRYTLTVPVACLSNHPDDPGTPAQVQLAPYFVYDSPLPANDRGAFDEIPAFPGYLPALTAAADPATPVTRQQGPSRVETAVAISATSFPADSSAGAVVLARADASPDALAGAPLAVAVNAPLLLTNRMSLPTAVEREIQRVLPSGGTVYLAGGPAAVGEPVVDSLEGLGYVVQRVAGETRYETSVAVAQATTDSPQMIVVADGNGFADALVGGAFAASRGGVQVLSRGNALEESVGTYLDAHPDVPLFAVGQLASAAVPQATALAGDDPFSTSVAVAGQYSTVDAVALASGTNFPDGLAGGAAAGRRSIPLLLTWPDVLPDPIRAYLQQETPLEGIDIFGGPVAVSHQIERDAAAALG